MKRTVKEIKRFENEKIIIIEKFDIIWTDFNNLENGYNYFTIDYLEKNNIKDITKIKTGKNNNKCVNCLECNNCIECYNCLNCESCVYCFDCINCKNMENKQNFEIIGK